jgi:hypothetical protein
MRFAPIIFTQGQFQLAAQLLTVRQVQLVFLHEQLAVHLVRRVFDQQLVLVFGQNNPNWGVVTLGVFFVRKVPHVHVHLSNVVVLNLVDFQVDQHEAAQDAVVKNQVHFVMRVADRDPVLPANEGEAFAQLEQELLQVIAEQGFEVGFGNLVRFWNFQEFKDVRFAHQVGGLLERLALRGELQDLLFVFAGGEAQEQGAVFLAFEFWDAPAFGNGLLFVKAALEVIVEFEQFDVMRPTQLVRRLLTDWITQVKKPHVDQVAAVETLAVKKAQVSSQVGHQGFAVFGFAVATLFIFDDVPSNLPVRFGDVRVDSLECPQPTLGESVRNLLEQVLVFVGVQFHVNPRANSGISRFGARP